jgi:hypothetical protein
VLRPSFGSFIPALLWVLGPKLKKWKHNGKNHACPSVLSYASFSKLSDVSRQNLVLWGLYYKLSSENNFGAYRTIITPTLYYKSKFVPVLFFNWAPRHGGLMGEWRYSSTHSLTSTLDIDEWSASRPDRFTPRERSPGTHWIGGWMGPRAVLVAVVKEKFPSRSGNWTLEPRSSSP